MCIMRNLDEGQDKQGWLNVLWKLIGWTIGQAMQDNDGSRRRGGGTVTRAIVHVAFEHLEEINNFK